MQLNLCNSGYLNFLQIQTIRTSNVHNFSWNLHNSVYSNFLQIQTICTSNVQNVQQNVCNFVHLTYPQKSNFLQIYTIRTSNVHNFLLNLCNSMYSNFLHIQTIRTYNVQKFHVQFTQFRTFNIFAEFRFSVNPDNPNIECIEFSVKFTHFRILKFS